MEVTTVLPILKIDFRNANCTCVDVVNVTSLFNIVAPAPFFPLRSPILATRGVHRNLWRREMREQWDGKMHFSKEKNPFPVHYHAQSFFFNAHSRDFPF